LFQNLIPLRDSGDFFDNIGQNAKSSERAILVCNCLKSGHSILPRGANRLMPDRVSRIRAVIAAPAYALAVGRGSPKESLANCSIQSRKFVLQLWP
jgi:hypothetical protein